MQLINIPPTEGNRLGILRRMRDKEILRITKDHPELGPVCEELATRSIDIDENDEVLKHLDFLCAEIHEEELSAVRRL